MLDATTMKAIARQIECTALAPHLRLTVRPYKLVIYKESGHFDAHRDTVRGDGHIGTLVIILNSEYTGGELEVTHGGRTEVVTGPYNWVAMYGDCLHKINPVTSGTRVSLIYDIYGTVPGDVTPTWVAAYDEEEDIGGEEEDEVVQGNGEDNEEEEEVGTQGYSETEGAQSESEGISEGDSEADEAAGDAYVGYGDENNDSDDEDEDDDVEYEADGAEFDAFDDDDHDDSDDGYGVDNDYDNDYDDEYESEEEAHHDYWEGQPRVNADPGCPRNPNDADIARVFEALAQDLKSFDTIIISLSVRPTLPSSRVVTAFCTTC